MANELLGLAGAGTGGLLAKGLIALVAAFLAYHLAKSGSRGFAWIAELTKDPRDDVFWRWLGRAWWLVVFVGLVSFLTYLFSIAIEPFHTWGSLLIRWMGSSGLAVLFIAVGTYVAYRLVGLMSARVKLGEGPEFIREQVRTKTLMGVVESTLKALVITLGTLLALSNMGINVGALVAGAGIAGLAISFAAQNLVRDVINGFFILLEDQYGVGDIIKVGDLAGGVERMNLRLTVLRDLEGRVHFIPNGQINQVTVMSRDWARALIDVGVAYKEDVDRALKIIEDEAEKFYHDPEWRNKFTVDPPLVLGVNELADSAVVIRVLFNTKAKEQWGVGREFRRRIKNRLDAEGIEIPFPQRTLWFGDAVRIERS